MSGGGGSPIARVMGQIDAQNAPTARSGASYTPVTPNTYAPAFSSNQAPQSAPAISPFVRQMSQQYTPMQAAGLAAMMSRFANQQQPSGIAGLPAYQSAALSYRPNMRNVISNLRNVAPPVTREQMHPTPPPIVASGGE